MTFGSKRTFECEHVSKLHFEVRAETNLTSPCFCQYFMLVQYTVVLVKVF